MSEDLKEYIRQWITKADRDLLAAQTIFAYKPLITDIICFHCQQASEKYLKAFILFKGEKITKTHSVDFLLQTCVTLDIDFSSMDAKNLDDFAVEARYPDSFLSPELSEVEYYLQLSTRIKQLVEKKIS